jgi:hypothetical protein
MGKCVMNELGQTVKRHVWHLSLLDRISIAGPRAFCSNLMKGWSVDYLTFWLRGLSISGLPIISLF